MSSQHTLFIHDFWLNILFFYWILRWGKLGIELCHFGFWYWIVIFHHIVCHHIFLRRDCSFALNRLVKRLSFEAWNSWFNIWWCLFILEMTFWDWSVRPFWFLNNFLVSIHCFLLFVQICLMPKCMLLRNDRFHWGYWIAWSTFLLPFSL